ncbi:uncharacterized protein MELLADRAFT_65601 [Melampsora larici-populina 98AG31]|uniref:Uncharacterized protein n=1 Tax=Melampsora larici-populina (strain 98AG31 / pathotype 3-4-7) TaxID=747676 RepID=F4RW11_MELLP|nr:uncharacterized protein MELLADRAFT_65601 [Melampsora larici-populina 98AG31]EGG03454.1 hypothetical protein MELLADRAFT_65601 [Melampsora larici-populina 98AG31]
MPSRNEPDDTKPIIQRNSGRASPADAEHQLTLIPKIESPACAGAIVGALETGERYDEESLTKPIIKSDNASPSVTDQLDEVKNLASLGRKTYKVRAVRAIRNQTEEAPESGSILCVTIPVHSSACRPDYPSRRAAFLYHFRGYYGDDTKPRYEPENTLGLSETIAVYQLGRTVDISLSRDSNEWQLREMRGDGVDMPHQGIARFHYIWAATATSGRDSAIELANGHVYVSQMLKRFKTRLLCLWKGESNPNSYLAVKFGEWFIRAAALHRSIGHSLF